MASSPERPRPDAARRKRGRPCKSYPSSQTPTIEDIHLAAGYYEGEGCYSNETVVINQNDREILDWLQIRFGGRVYGPYTGKPKGNDYYRWVLARERALGFMFTIFTFLSRSRRDQFKTGKREYQQSFSNNGVSEALIKRKLSNHISRRKGMMGLFGVKK